MCGGGLKWATRARLVLATGDFLETLKIEKALLGLLGIPSVDGRILKLEIQEIMNTVILKCSRKLAMLANSNMAP